MDKNELLKPVTVRLMDDTELQDLIGDDVPVIKGPRKTNGADECITINAPSAPMNPDSRAYNGTILINYYCPNYPSGNANLEKMGPVAARIEELFHDDPLEIPGYKNYNLAVDEPMGPLFDPDEPDEHFMSVRINFGLIKRE